MKPIKKKTRAPKLPSGRIFDEISRLLPQQGISGADHANGAKSACSPFSRRSAPPFLAFRCDLGVSYIPSDGGPRVRILLPPARSQQRTGSSPDGRGAVLDPGDGAGVNTAPPRPRRHIPGSSDRSRRRGPGPTTITEFIRLRRRSRSSATRSCRWWKRFEPSALALLAVAVAGHGCVRPCARCGGRTARCVAALRQPRL